MAKSKLPEVIPVKDEEALPPVPPPDAEPRLKKFKIVFKDCPDLEFEAEDKHDAWEQYKKYCGIIDTIHKPQISVVK